jgi:acetyl-CoA carboxylase biotin carboxyl carrier protein
MNAAAQTGDPNGLIDLIDRLEELLNSSELSEIEVEAGGTALVLRKPIAVEPADLSAVLGQSPTRAAEGEPARRATDAPPPNAIVAPLTGLFYTSPSPGAEPYVREGGQVMVGRQSAA